eukprot:6857221-Pyramimonas_sp.AAC.1
MCTSFFVAGGKETVTTELAMLPTVRLGLTGSRQVFCMELLPLLRHVGSGKAATPQEAKEFLKNMVTNK